MINDQSLYFVFNGKKSSDFGVWCSGDGLYRLPERDVEYIAVPGRNGDLAVDNGRWMNVEVTYSCFIPKHFREHYSDLVSWLASQKGYGRLEDARHPEFYWLARMDADVDPKMVVADDGGTFTLTFNCKPQRFLKSGEIPVEIPCEPADSPASARRYWRWSSFTENAQNSLPLSDYTQTEINAMQFEILQVPDDVLERMYELGEAEDASGLLTGKGLNHDRFFAATFFDDPTVANSASYRFINEPPTKWYAKYFYIYYPMTQTHRSTKYIVLRKSFGTELYFLDELLARDETYQFGGLYNPTNFDSNPIVKLKLPDNLENMEGATVYLFGIGQNGISLTLDDNFQFYGGSTLTVDCDLMDVYMLPEDNEWLGEFVSFNKYAKFFGERIVLKPGENTIRLDPMIAGCEIVPRWWTI